jgi:hypothetical protein
MMNWIYNNNANLFKLLIVPILFISVMNFGTAQETDPITQAINKEKNQQPGINLFPDEQQELDRINSKYAINEKELVLRSKKASGQRLGFFDNFRIGRSNRKDYVRNKKVEKFNRKVILNRQSEATRKRMLENEKRIKKRDKRLKREQRRKRFFSLFR